jgi:hypothetical protein
MGGTEALRAAEARMTSHWVYWLAHAHRSELYV